MQRRRCQPLKANSHQNKLQKGNDSLALSKLVSHRKKADLIQNNFPMITCESHTNRSRSDRALNYFQPYLAFISACTCSHGIPRSGCAIASWARRSISASSSRVKSGSYPSSSSWKLSQRLSKTCCFSFAGSGRICSIISATVMAGIYFVDSRAQRLFRRADSSFIIQHSSFSPA